jgi:hypothetical protein
MTQFWEVPSSAHQNSHRLGVSSVYLAPALRFALFRSPKKSVGRVAPSFGYYGICKHSFAEGVHPQSCISIHRCYKL